MITVKKNQKASFCWGHTYKNGKGSISHSMTVKTRKFGQQELLNIGGELVFFRAVHLNRKAVEWLIKELNEWLDDTDPKELK